MLEVICGSKNATRVLLFLFVNGKGYGAQLHQMLKTALTPIQKTLARLEEGGVIMSYYEGKTRLYQFNPAYPLLSELENLLKKAYTLLPPHEKRLYHLTKPSNVKANESWEALNHFWKRLKDLRKLTFHAKSKSGEEGGWNGKGKGEISVANEGETVLIFNEKGSWQGGNGEEIAFSNIFRWTFDRSAGMIALEHLRYGLNHPVLLFHLAPSGSNTLASLEAHLCGEDAYSGHIFFDAHSLRLNWRVIGPKKNEEINYFYS